MLKKAEKKVAIGEIKGEYEKCLGSVMLDEVGVGWGWGGFLDVMMLLLPRSILLLPKPIDFLRFPRRFFVENIGVDVFFERNTLQSYKLERNITKNQPIEQYIIITPGV